MIVLVLNRPEKELTWRRRSKEADVDVTGDRRIGVHSATSKGKRKRPALSVVQRILDQARVNGVSYTISCYLGGDRLQPPSVLAAKRDGPGHKVHARHLPSDLV